MHIPRFFLTTDELGATGTGPQTPLDFVQGQAFDITGKVVANQISNVLRLRAGDRLIVLNGSGRLYRCHIDRMDRRAITCTVDQVEQAGGDAPAVVTVALAVIKGDRFEWCLQKLTELGVSSVVPLITARTIVKLDTGTTGDAKGNPSKIARWQAILREAAEQCERATIPYLHAPKKLEDFISSCVGGGTSSEAFICAERLSTTPLKDIFLDHARDNLKRSATADKTINLIIGPEGGFTEEEIQYAEDQGVKPVSLGRRILRSETAAIYALAQVIWCLEN
jgi:16S rRNA (uracil1498-N3)-methyltransferase